MLLGLSGALFVGPAQAHRQPRSAAGEDVEARPLLGEEDRMAVHERRQAAHSEAEVPGRACESSQQGHRFQARLGQEAVPDPGRVERAGRLRLLGQLEQVPGLTILMITPRLASVSPKEATVPSV